ncbi:MAG TPA: MFS transporter [Alphaproteobacteria bacterium]|nr:MFS transporter [Alphaproteobacteria bacterium]
MSTQPQSFAALRHPGFRAYFTCSALAMMADSIEHVISYWIIFQKFHAPALGGFAILSHWLPMLLFGVPMGALADRLDPRRLIQIGMLCFMAASLSWSLLFLTESLQMWHAVVILIIHGIGSLFWNTPSQLLIHDIVGPTQLPSAVRLNATGRYLGLLAGPAVGGGILLLFGPAHGLMLNVLIYLPLVLWLWKAPYGPRFRAGAPAPRRAIRGFADIVQTVRDVAGNRIVASMIVLAGGYALLVGNAYQAQMPEFARDLGHGDAGPLYSMLLAADATGAFIAGILLETRGLLQPRTRTAFILAMLWCIAIGAFATARSYPVALFLLFAAGFLELSFSAMAQALVQIHAPAEIRGRVIGLYGMGALGLRAFSGVTVGVVGGMLGIHWSLALSAGVLLALITGLLTFSIRPAAVGVSSAD